MSKAWIPVQANCKTKKTYDNRHQSQSILCKNKDCSGTFLKKLLKLMIQIMQTFSGHKNCTGILYLDHSVQDCSNSNALTHWGRVTHICIVKLTIIDSDKGLSPGRHQAIIWSNAGILLIGPLGTNLIEILIGIQTFSFRKMHFDDVVCEMASILSRPQCVSNVTSVLH